jgi:hypothetical protein
VKSRSKELIHLELVDMRKINELLEAHRLIFENVLTSMVMTDSRGYIIRCNRHTEQVDACLVSNLCTYGSMPNHKVIRFFMLICYYMVLFKAFGYSVGKLLGVPLTQVLGTNLEGLLRDQRLHKDEAHAAGSYSSLDSDTGATALEGAVYQVIAVTQKQS